MKRERISLRGRLLRSALRKTNNLNPEQTPDAVTKMRKLTSPFATDRVPSGFSCERRMTENGTRYEHISKAGAEKNGRLIYYLHGGAYISGILSVYRDLERDYFDACGCEMIMLDYSLAPESVYPTQLNEAFDLWLDITENMGYLPENTVIAGDSAGANLTLALMQRLRDGGYTMPLGGVCMSLWGDMSAMGESYIANYGKDIMFGIKNKVFDPNEREKLLDSLIYCFRGDADKYDPYISPVYGSYHGFPPMYLTAGGDEMLLSDTLTVAEKLKSEGIYTECDIAYGMFHIYTVYGAVFSEGRRSRGKICDFISRLFKGEIKNENGNF